MKRLLLAALALAFAGSAHAQGYAGLGFSTAASDLRGASADGSASEFVLGYRLTKHFAAELSYLDGDGRTDLIPQGSTSSMLFWKSRGPGIAAVGILPVGAFSLVGKVGAYRLKTSLRELVTGPGGTLSDTTTTASDWQSTFGFGAQYALTDGVSLRAMLERIDSKGDLDAVTLYSAGIELRF